MKPMESRARGLVLCLLLFGVACDRPWVSSKPPDKSLSTIEDAAPTLAAATARSQAVSQSLPFGTQPGLPKEQGDLDKAPLFAEQEIAPVLYHGLCDASAVVALSDTHFVVGDDEDNILRVYRSNFGQQPVWLLNLSSFLRVDPGAPEVDIEGAARLGSRIYWISSHGRNVKGQEAPSRHRFFATSGSVSNGRVDLRPIGRPYFNLLSDLLHDPRLVPFNLAKAATLAPKAPGGLNIEGLSATPEGYLLIGFRSPTPANRALLVPLLNPAELIEGRRARFGSPILQDLKGRGIRSITRCFNQYLIVAGSPQEGGKSHLYLWDGVQEARRVHGIKLTGLNPEAVSYWEETGNEHLYVLSDDGTQEVYGTDCKKLKVSSWKRFRGVSLKL